MATATPTKPSPPKLSEVARRVHAPAGIVATGWPAVEAKSRDLGIAFRWWQCLIGKLVLAKRADGTYASTIGGTGLSIPRQVGKTFLVAAVMFSLCLLRPGFTVIWTAHRLKTAEETFGKLQVFAKRQKIAPHIRQVRTGSGDQVIIFRNGSRILFGARERGFGRGFDEVDALVFDEAQHLTDSALDDMVPATNQSRQPEGALMLFMGTPPRPQDPGEVFTRMRTDAEAGDEDTGWIEFGADPDYTPTPLPAALTDADWGQITTANPSFPADTSKTAILRMRKKLGDESFLREGLGIWTDRVSASERFRIAWEASADPDAQRGQTVAFGVAVAPDREWSAIAVAWKRPDGRVQVMVADYKAGTDWTNARAAELKRKWGGRFFTSTGAKGMAPRAVHLSESDQALAHTGLDDLLLADRVRHGNEPALNISVRAAQWKPFGNTRRLDRKGTTDITPLDAAAVAVHGLVTRSAGRFRSHD